jgi:hypothetical protein
LGERSTFGFVCVTKWIVFNAILFVFSAEFVSITLRRFGMFPLSCYIPCARVQDGKTALDCATEEGKRDVVRLIEVRLPTCP